MRCEFLRLSFVPSFLSLNFIFPFCHENLGSTTWIFRRETFSRGEDDLYILIKGKKRSMENVESRCCRVSTENTSVLDARLTSSVSIDAPRDYRASYRESRQRGKMGLARRGEVDRSRGNKDSGDLRPDKRESSILIPARVCVYTSFSRTHAFRRIRALSWYSRRNMLLCNDLWTFCRVTL